jgi:hypothetical protein
MYVWQMQQLLYFDTNECGGSEEIDDESTNSSLTININIDNPTTTTLVIIMGRNNVNTINFLNVTNNATTYICHISHTK